jgi:hypothetical protein
MDNYKIGSYRRIKKIYTFLIITYPILGIYSTQVPGVTIADSFLLILYPILLLSIFNINKRISKTINFPILIYIAFIIFHLFLTLTISNIDTGDVLLRTLRYVFYLSTLALFTKTFFDIRYAKNVLKCCSIFASLYLMLQFVLYDLWGYYLPGALPIFKLQVDTINEIYARYLQGYYIRVHSIFAEPSHFAIYVLLYLAINLNETKNKALEFIPAILVSIAILLSQSSTGIIITIFIWFKWYFRRVSIKEIKRRKVTFILLTIFLIPIVFGLLIQTPFFKVFLSRTFSGEGLGEAARRRLGNYEVLSQIYNKFSFSFISGKGMIPLQIYFPGIARLLLYFGLIGLLLFVVLYLRVYIRSNKVQKEILLIFFILNIGTEILFGNFILLYMSFALVDDEKLVIREGVNQ